MKVTCNSVSSFALSEDSFHKDRNNKHILKDYYLNIPRETGSYILQTNFACSIGISVIFCSSHTKEKWQEILEQQKKGVSVWLFSAKKTVKLRDSAQGVPSVNKIKKTEPSRSETRNYWRQLIANGALSLWILLLTNPSTLLATTMLQLLLINSQSARTVLCQKAQIQPRRLQYISFVKCLDFAKYLNR